MKLKTVDTLAEERLTAILGPKDDPYYQDRLIGHAWGCIFRSAEVHYDIKQRWIQIEKKHPLSKIDKPIT